MFRLRLFIFCVLFTACFLSGCHGAEQKIPIPFDAHGLRRHNMSSVSAHQVDFYLPAKKDDMSVFGFYSEKFDKNGWVPCSYGANWFDYRKAIKNHEYIDVRQNSRYMISSEKKQLLVIVAQYFLSNSRDINRPASQGQLKQHVKVVLYQLDDRGYAMALNKYGCMSKSDANH